MNLKTTFFSRNMSTNQCRLNDGGNSVFFLLSAKRFFSIDLSESYSKLLPKSKITCSNSSSMVVQALHLL